MARGGGQEGRTPHARNGRIRFLRGARGVRAPNERTRDRVRAATRGDPGSIGHPIGRARPPRRSTPRGSGLVTYAIRNAGELASPYYLLEVWARREEIDID